MNTQYTNLTKLLDEVKMLVTQDIQLCLAKFLSDSEIKNAAIYSSIPTGKMLRALMLIIVADNYNVERKVSIKLASAVELVHTSSLIHDDLPALDNDDYRRGRKSCHKEYSEATALLAGNALLTIPYKIISEIDTLHHIACKKMINALSSCYLNILQGQELDIKFQKNYPFIDEQLRIKLIKLKTGSLFATSCQMGAFQKVNDMSIIEQLSQYGSNFGIGFQIYDDIIDKDISLTQGLKEFDYYINKSIICLKSQCKLLKEFTEYFSFNVKQKCKELL